MKTVSAECGDVMPLAKNKLSLIHVAKAQLRMSDDDYRAILRRVAGVESSRDLDDLGFELLIAEFQRLGFQSTFSQQNLGMRAGMASAGQVAVIRKLWSDFTSGKGTDASLGHWLERQFKISSIRFLPAESAPKVIAALKAMKKRKQIA